MFRLAIRRSLRSIKSTICSILQSISLIRNLLNYENLLADQLFLRYILAQRQRALNPPVSEDGMHDEAATRREARRLILTRAAGDAGANSATPFFTAADGASNALALAGRASRRDAAQR